MNIRKPQYLSPSALKVYETDPSAYFIQYLCPVKIARPPQTLPMAVGSAFDAHAKSFLHDKIYGKGHKESNKYSREALLEAQVEKQCRAEANIAGQYVFERYVESGAMADMLIELDKAVESPRFEFELRGTVSGEFGGVNKGSTVVLLGKPDIRFINGEGQDVIWDWKVNGYCSRSAVSPMKGYIQCRDCSEGGYWERKGCHKDVIPGKVGGMQINIADYLENFNSEWATQLFVYNALMGQPVGKENVVGIDQIVGCGEAKRWKGTSFPVLRVATHLNRISSGFQFGVMARFQRLWDLINTEPFHFFREVSPAESQGKCELLLKRAELLQDPSQLTSDEAWLLQVSRE